MTEKIVINTSPLLAFSRMQAFDLIGRLPFEFISPAEVENEILIGAKQGYDAQIPLWLKIETLKSPLSSLAVASLDAGEAAVIQLALEQNIETVCIDELKGRRAAKAVGLNVVGSLGLLGKAKTKGLIAEVKSFLEKAIQAGIYYDEKLIENFLRSLGE
jgi:predicted nucleic acid-binding protein